MEPPPLCRDRAHPGRSDLAAVHFRRAKRGSYRGEAAKAFVKLKPGARPFSLEELRAQLAGKVGKHELPAEVAFVDDLPRTPVGKLSRHELRQQHKSSQSQPAPGGRS
nr:hypothetical protein [Salmonella enterica]